MSLIAQRVFGSVADSLLRRVLAGLCGLMLLLMVALTCYTVVMRGVFNDPPFWGDTLTLFANIWFVMLAFPLSIRERSSIAMQAIHRYLPAQAVALLELVWNLLFGAVGLLLLVYGYQVADRIPGAYWELDNLPKSVPMMILPITGLLTLIAVALVVREDVETIRRAGDPPNSSGASPG
ncbi:MAG: TRAP transporter small permease subunit [Lautropia sp.]